MTIAADLRRIADSNSDLDAEERDQLRQAADALDRQGALDQIVEDCGALIGKLSFIGGRVLVRHGPEIHGTNANLEWWDRLRALALTIKALPPPPAD